MKRITLVLICLTLLLSCSLFDSDRPDELSNEEHAIISVVLDSLMQNRTLETIDVFDQTTTGTNRSSLNILLDQESMGSETLLNNYDNANRKPYELDMDKLPGYVMLKDTEEAEPYSGYYAFTRPGISDDGRWAVVEYSSISAPLAGCGMAAVLEKQFGEWVMVLREMIWIS